MPEDPDAAVLLAATLAAFPHCLGFIGPHNEVHESRITAASQEAIKVGRGFLVEWRKAQEAAP